jgi:hypothetical protein
MERKIRIKWSCMPEWAAVTKMHEGAPTTAHEREAIKNALWREGRLEEHRLAIIRARERVPRWFKDEEDE